MPKQETKPAPQPNTDVSAIFKVINNRTYCSDILPHDFSCLLQLLQYGKQQKKDAIYVERVLRLFTRLVKEAPCINAYAFKDTIARMPELMKDSLKPLVATTLDTKTLLEMELVDRFKGSVNSLLYNKFLHDYSGFKKEPDLFLEQISQQVTTLFEQETDNSQTRAVLMRFLETCMAKLAWSPDAHELIWNSTKEISHNLKKFSDQSILEDMDDLDDLYWSLIHRFCFFLDIFGTTLSTDFYDTIQRDIAQKKLDLTELEEQQDWLICKADFLRSSVEHHKTRLLAFQNGILTR